MSPNSRLLLAAARSCVAAPDGALSNKLFSLVEFSDGSFGLVRADCAVASAVRPTTCALRAATAAAEHSYRCLVFTDAAEPAPAAADAAAAQGAQLTQEFLES